MAYFFAGKHGFRVSTGTDYCYDNYRSRQSTTKSETMVPLCPSYCPYVRITLTSSVEICDGYGSPITKKDDYYLNPSSQHDNEFERFCHVCLSAIVTEQMMWNNDDTWNQSNMRPSETWIKRFNGSDPNA